jgi:hypothetical protein
MTRRAGCEPACGNIQVRPTNPSARQAGSLAAESAKPADIQLASPDRGLLFALMKLFP